jgi:putative membrane protein
MRIFVWLVRAAIFFTLFAFALNNQHEGNVRWFFGLEWRAPMVFIVLAAFAGGCLIGVLSMLPGWWTQRRRAKRLAPPAATSIAPDSLLNPITRPSIGPSTESPVTVARRDGL